jgi:hypothetical protein
MLLGMLFVPTSSPARFSRRGRARTVRRAPSGALGTAGRMLGIAATQLLVALAWVPFVAFPFGTLGTIPRIYARLLGFR